MFGGSVVVVVGTLALVGLALVAWAAAWRAGAFRDVDAQARVILDPRDLRLDRPWETAHQRADRRASHGEPLPPEPGEWGGTW